MKLTKWNRRKKIRFIMRAPDAAGNPRKIVIWYDDLSKAKKPPAWMKELLFSDDAA